MRRTIAVLLLLLCCSSLWAADAPANRWRVSLLASEISKGGNEVWAHGTRAGVGVGIAYAPTPLWDVELTVAKQSYISPATVFVGFPTSTGDIVVPFTDLRKYDVYPVDLSVTRHFLDDQIIAPYIKAGVRYVAAPKNPYSQVTQIPTGPIPLGFDPVVPGFGFDDRVSGQVGAGLRVRITPRVALRAEVTRLLRRDEADFDPLTRLAVGVSWSF